MNLGIEYEILLQAVRKLLSDGFLILTVSINSVLNLLGPLEVKSSLHTCGMNSLCRVNSHTIVELAA